MKEVQVIDKDELLRKIRIDILGKKYNESNYYDESIEEINNIMNRILNNIYIMDKTWDIKDTSIIQYDGFVGKFKYLIKKLVRKSIFWLIKPYWQQQINFNAATIRAIGDCYKILNKLIENKRV